MLQKADKWGCLMRGSGSSTISSYERLMGVGQSISDKGYHIAFLGPLG